MNEDTTAILDAALHVFLRYGFKRTTMGDIAKMAGLSRQSLYARFANKDEVYAAGLLLYTNRTVAKITSAWEAADTLSDKLDCLYDLSLRPTYEMLRTSPEAADIVEAAETPSGREAMQHTRARKIAMIASLLAPYAPALDRHGQTPADLGAFAETALHGMLTSAEDIDELKRQFASLKAAILSMAAAS